MKEDIRIAIDALVNSSAHQMFIPRCPISLVSEMMKGFGYTEGDISTNGYQVDFWQYYVYEGKPDIVLYGDLFYEEWYKLYKDEENTTKERNQKIEGGLPEGQGAEGY